MMKNVSLGLRAKTGKAIAVAICAGKNGPEFVGRWNVLLHDPAVPETGMPHHYVMELPWAEAQRAVKPYEKKIERLAAATLTAIAGDLKRSGYQMTSVGVVGSPERDLSKIGNFHIRAHGAEGILFRRVIELAAEKKKLRWRGFSDREFLPAAAAELRIPEERLNDALSDLGKAAGRPWRKEERLAAAAAWIVSTL
jgi:hypothetical protein